MIARPERAGWILGLTWLAAFTSILDTTIVNLALPQLGAAFGTSASTLAWLVNAYLLPFAVSILAVGRLGDGLGKLRVFAGGAVLFGIGSLGAAAAPSFAALLAMRVLQGLGASALLTLSLAIVSSAYSPAERPRALGVYFSGGTLGGVVGPIAGGMLASVWGWRAMFALQVPLAIGLLIASVVLLREARGPHRSLDLAGLAAGTLLLVGVNVALLQAHEWGWLSPRVLGAWMLGAVGLALFIARERRAREPAVRLAVFRNRRFVAASLTGAAMWFGIISGSVQLAIYLQRGRGLDPLQAALVLAPSPLVGFFLFPRAGAIAKRLGESRAMLGAAMLGALIAALLVGIDAATPYLVLALLGMASGVAVSLGILTSAAGAVAEFAPQDAGAAAGVFNSIRQVGSALGVAIPVAAFDLAAGGAFGGDVVFDGVRWALVARALVIMLAVAIVAALLRRGAVATRPVVAAVAVSAPRGT